jgi:hypothetical protein
MQLSHLHQYFDVIDVLFTHVNIAFSCSIMVGPLVIVIRFYIFPTSTMVYGRLSLNLLSQENNLN